MEKKIAKSIQRVLAMLLCVAMLLPMAAIPGYATEPEEIVGATEVLEETGEIALDLSTVNTAVPLADDAETPLAVVYAASDFQLTTGSGSSKADDITGGKKIMNNIIDKMQVAGYENNVTGALFCGDYSGTYNTWSKEHETACDDGLAAVADVLEAQWGLTHEDVVYVQGNHDPANTDGLDPSGANDTQYYGVYVLHEDDYRWKQGDTEANSGNSGSAQTVTQNTAKALESYLKAKADEKYDQPIFIISHVPLHFGYRTTSAKGGDNIYAKYIFDVLNEYGEELDIIFLFGHNHSSTYDDYLGGGAVYLPVGDKIWVPNAGSNSAWTEYTLNFTYMNAGYVGYYGGECDIGLSSTIFEIYEDKVVIGRYTADGLADLKVAGVKASTDTWTGAAANSAEYTSNQEINPMKEFHVDLDAGTLASGIMFVGNAGDLKVRGLYQTTYDVAWSSSDDSIAAVAPSADGMTATVTANAAGTVTITAVATETGKTRAVGESATLTYNLQILDNTSGDTAVLLAAGDYTFFKKVDSVEIGKTYAFIDIEDEGYLIGKQEALHFNNNIDATKEGDIDAAADSSGNYQEVNASGQYVFQLPVGSEVLTLADITNKNCWWIADVAKESGNTGGTIRTYTDRTYNYLFVIEGDSDFLDRDKDQDRLATGDEKEASSTGGAHWYYDATHGLVTNTKTDGFQFALYYSQANTDFSAYRINHNGAHGDSKFNESGTLADEQPTSRVYAFEQTTVTLANPITAQLSNLTGYVNKDVGYTDADGKQLGGTQTGSTLLLNNGTTTIEIPVTIDMLSGTFDVTTPGTYYGLTVTYAGAEIATNYSLVVRDSTTLLKNDAAREYMDTIYTRVDKWVPGRQYLIVDTDEAGIAHAMGVTSGKVTAHNVLVQELPVDGKDMLYIDSSRYSAKADTTAANLVGRNIVDQGNINEYLNESITKDNYYNSIALVWTLTQRFFPTDGSPEISDVRNKDYYFLTSQVQFAKNEANRTLYIGANAEDTQLKLGSEAYTVGKETDDPTGATADWWWELWQYSTTTGVHLAPKQAAHAYLFYNWQNVDGNNSTSNAANKNFQTEEATSGDFTLNTYRRTWIYERVTNIDTISGRISDKTTSVVARTENSQSTNASTFIGDYILVDTTHADGTVTTEQVPITISMLTGTYDLTTPGTYPNLTVNYQGKEICTDYTVIVTEFVANDYPEFPDEGAVRIDKQLDTTKYDYLDTGVASIDLSVTGIPAQTGVDLVVILDASSSMQNCPHGSYAVGKSCGTCGTVTYNETRMGLMESTLESMLKQLQEPIEGYVPDVDVAIATFNGYTPINTDYEFWYSGTKSDGTGSELTHNGGQQTEEERPDASQILLEFTNIADVDPSFKNKNTTSRDIDYNKGTNYDRGIEIAYQLLKAKQEQNALNGVARDAVVVFMSDGAPYQFNYFHGDPNVPSWASYLQGTLTASSTGVTKQSAAVEAAFAKYYNNEGKHWMTEAIKADPNTTNKIIDRHAMTEDHITYVNGLGATLYSIGFGLAGDHVVTKEICEQVLTDMATDAEHYIPAANGTELEAAFSKIAGEIRKAGNAVFTDQMGQYFDLVTSNKIEITNDIGETEYVDLTSNPPTITVKSYQLYKRSEIGKTLTFGDTQVTVTETMVGSRKPVDPTILETITFNEDGSVVTSDKKSGNILNSDGVICAATFWYNTDLQNAHDITVGSKTVSLDTETFYWNVGDIPQDELVLSYSVYLSGSREGLRPSGTYDTNAHAELNYTNYLGNECELSVPTPKLPWQQATVGYGFYLVDGNGNPIINQTTGETGSFEQSVRVTELTYLDFLLNSEGEDIIAEIVSAGNVLPDGYTLFDADAQYEVSLDSDGTGYYTVTVGENMPTTTYVVGIESAAFKPTGKSETDDYITANTAVWFAVVATVQCVPDTVVIDYGLPVDINVLGNDTMMGTSGKLAAIGQTTSFTGDAAYDSSVELWKYLQSIGAEKTSRFTTQELDGKYGDLKVLTADGKTTGEVRYTLNDASTKENNGMNMATEETFVYTVDYNGTVGTNGYYYSTVTVIPATTIYYEDNFVTYHIRDYNTGEILDKEWSVVKDAEASATQEEDRPGEFNLSDLDANNIYGYDGAYTNCTTYSNGSARYATVSATFNEKGKVTGGEYATAEFTFTGTGFDIVSVTSNTTGSILVEVKGTDYSKNFMVDTYYGYKREFHKVTYTYVDGEWIIQNESDDVVITEAEMGTPVDAPENPTENQQYTTYETEWVVDPDADGALYQIPVMKVADLPYGTYTVVISASYAKLFDHGQYDGETKYDFYLDAIRIYDPANDGEGNQVIEDAYVADGEGWPSYEELRNILIAANTFNALDDNETISGVVFIDGNKALTDDNASNVDGSVSDNLQAETKAAIEDYANFGPNNEVYLAPGQGIAFQLNLAENVAGIHMAMKSVGGTAKVKVYDAANKAETIAVQTIQTATDLYYDITDLNGKTVVILNAGNDADAILSITNIKTTYTVNPNGVAASSFMITRSAAAAALYSLEPVVEDIPEEIVPEETVPEETVPEETEPEVFEPKKFSVKLSGDYVTVGTKVIVTVTTSADVDYIEINGVQVTDYSTSRRGQERTWKVKVTAETVGEMSINVICYNADGLASQMLAKNVTVIKGQATVVDLIKDLIGRFLGRWG